MNRFIKGIGLFVLAFGLLSGSMAIVLIAALNVSGRIIDYRYLPGAASLQAHADRIAVHFVDRLMEAPPPLLRQTLVPDSIPRTTLGPALHLTTSSMPARYGITWSNESGLTMPPGMPEDLARAVDERFTSLASYGPLDDAWFVPMLVSFEQHYDLPFYLAGELFRDGDRVQFRGALTPIDAFHEVYAPVWFEEYSRTMYGSLFSVDFWKAAEVRLVPEDSTMAPVVLKRSEAVSLNVDDFNGDVDPARAARLAKIMNKRLSGEPGWLENAEWAEARLWPLHRAKILVAAPFQFDRWLAEKTMLLVWWALGSWGLAMIVIAILVKRRRIALTKA